MYRWIFVAVTVFSCLPARSAEAGANTDAARRAPPPLPPAPVEYFRQLLNMKPDERAAELSKRPKTREFLEAKLKEYEGLPPEVRENRLRTLELQAYLRPLMKASATNRAAQLQGIPERDRPLVEARLKLWDQMSEEEKRDMLESELAIRALSRPEQGLVTHAGFSMITPQQQERINRSVDFMNQLPDEKRDRMYRNFNRFFELSENEKTKTLESFSETDRKRMEMTLQAFEKLPPQERERCIAGFEKFRALSRDEQDYFLKSAERWRAMTPKDRQIWRSLVSRKAVPAPPPMPPGFSNPAATLPPSEILVVTNTNR